MAGNLFLKDSDINLQLIKKRLSNVYEDIEKNNKLNLTDINVICEEIFGQILNKIYGLNLISVSFSLSSTYVAVDLIDENKKIAFQVTSQSGRKKIKQTIKKFNESKLYEKVDDLYFLILSKKNHRYEKSYEDLKFKNGKTFSFEDNILNFDKLISEIEKYSKDNKDLIVEIYECISMVCDTGRLKYSDILEFTNTLMANSYQNSDNFTQYICGSGDVQLLSFLPCNYQGKLSCAILFRQYNLSGLTITLNHDEILEYFFVSEEEFINNHIKMGRTKEEVYLTIKGNGFFINAHTAYHLYVAFQKFYLNYKNTIKEIDKTLGTKNFDISSGKYLLMSLDKNKFNEVIFFINNNQIYKKGHKNQWVTLKCNCLNQHLYIDLHSYKNDLYMENPLAKLLILYNKSYDNYDIFWIPSYISTRNVPNYDNILKWKADFTESWIINMFLPDIHVYFQKNVLKRFLLLKQICKALV